MKIAIIKESNGNDRRVPMIPADVGQLVSAGAQVEVQAALGSSLGFDDEQYGKAGAKVTENRQSLLEQSDIVLRLNAPTPEEAQALKDGSLHISHLNPLRIDKKLIDAFLQRRTSAFSLEMIPRSTRAQKMDVISSQTNLAGYVAVILAAERSDKILPMMMTPAGTITPARVFIIGVGVAGLQAIATAKRLGARVFAYDTRPVVEEQVQSLGAKFVKFDLGETGQTKDGYAKALTEEQLQKQRQEMGKHCAQADIVITTAQVFGKPAPRIITREMINQMKAGSIIVDMAVESGGNVEGSMPDQEIEFNRVKVIGLKNLPARVAVHASQMFSSNVKNFMLEYWDKTDKRFQIKSDDDIIKSTLVCQDGRILNERFKELK